MFLSCVVFAVTPHISAFQTPQAKTCFRWKSRLETQSSSPEDQDDKKNPGLLKLAELSLKDYDWRSSLFKSEEADRKVEESLARMMGDEPSYVRPMDASEEKIGPLVSLVFMNMNSTPEFRFSC